MQHRCVSPPRRTGVMLMTRGWRVARIDDFAASEERNVSGSRIKRESRARLLLPLLRSGWQAHLGYVSGAARSPIGRRSRLVAVLASQRVSRAAARRLHQEVFPAPNPRFDGADGFSTRTRGVRWSADSRHWGEESPGAPPPSRRETLGRPIRPRLYLDAEQIIRVDWPHARKQHADRADRTRRLAGASDKLQVTRYFPTILRETSLSTVQSVSSSLKRAILVADDSVINIVLQSAQYLVERTR